jgi:hypothetical protein
MSYVSSDGRAEKVSVVDAEFARQLEVENAALVAALEHLMFIADDTNLSEACAYVPELRAIVDDARAALKLAQGGAA